MDRPETDQESRTEEATEKRIADALEEGNTPSTPEASVLGTLVAGALVVLALVVPIGARIGADLALLLESAGSRPLRTPAEAATLLMDVTRSSAGGVALLAIVFVGLGLGAAALQGNIRVATKRIAPRMDNVSPLRGLSRIFGTQALIQIGKTLLKLLVIAGVGGWMIWRDATHYEPLVTTDVATLGSELALGVGTLLAGSAVVAAVIFAIDLTLARIMWRRGLRMTREEVSRDLRETEGEPLLKSRRLAIARGRARRRTLAAVPRATMVIVNPTHYAVALRYVHGQERAPQVVAKGLDLVAMAIRRIAEEQRIPVVEDRALARSLYGRVEVDQQIPPEFYRAIAGIVATLRGRSGQASAPRM